MFPTDEPTRATVVPTSSEERDCVGAGERVWVGAGVSEGWEEGVENGNGNG